MGGASTTGGLRAIAAGAAAIAASPAMPAMSASLATRGNCIDFKWPLRRGDSPSVAF